MCGASPAQRVINHTNELLRRAEALRKAEQAFRASGSQVRQGCGITEQARALREAQRDFDEQLERVTAAAANVTE